MVHHTDSNTPCRHCHSPAKYQFGTYDYNRNRSRDRFKYYYCSHCKLVFISPIPQNLNDYYSDEYYEIPADLDQLAKRSEGEQYKIEIVKRRKQEGRLLEIGSSYGSFAYLAKKSGYDVTCIEMDANCCAFINDVVNVKAISTNDVTQILGSLGEFDIIVLWHVIEHVSEPWFLLEALVKHIAQDGILVISTPNPNSLQFRMFRARWAHLDAPRHLQLIPLVLIMEELSDLGMKMVDYMTNDRGGLGWNTFGWRKSLENFGKGALIGNVFSVFGKAVSILVGPIERPDLYGSTYTVIFQK